MIVTLFPGPGGVRRVMLTVRKRRAADRDCAVPHMHVQPRRTHHMNVITDLLAGIIHFVGWLV
ncbi:hypothetical protein GCM10010393_42730 [Streptomyces gobitricini]|uniref:Transposase n=1 Tax=Streptomyces gobitricini TaxID=68211 RepID=A0ABP5ZVX2_9ACTN